MSGGHRKLSVLGAMRTWIPAFAWMTPWIYARASELTLAL